MSDIFTVLSSAYSTAPSTTSNVKYTPVNAKSYEGNWSGTYSNGKKFDFQISQINGFRAQVKYRSGGTTQYQQVLIGNSSFRLGNTKFVLTGNGKATVGNVITDPVTGNTTLVKGNATQNT
jgi:hypothetical protein